MNNEITFFIAFGAGFLSFLSPCVLPLIPGYVSFISGISFDVLQNKFSKGIIFKKVFISSLFFVAGFSLIFIALGASASFLGKFLSRNFKLFSQIAGILIIIFGLNFLGVFKIKYLNFQKTFNVKQSSGKIGSFLVGLAFGFGWMPCIGPILSGILALAATGENIKKGVFLLSGYSLGLALPFLLSACAMGAFFDFFKKYKPFLKIGEILSGLLLIFIGILIFSRNLTFLLKFIPSYFYKFIK